jgi:hypothetical protein
MAKQKVENAIYTSIVSECKRLENKKKYRGSGKKLAQKLSFMVSVALLPKQQRDIYEVLTIEPKTANQISSKLKLTSKLVSAQLNQMQKNTSLISSKQKDKKNKLWYRVV